VQRTPTAIKVFTIFCQFCTNKCCKWQQSSWK